MSKFLFSHIVSGFFVSLFLLGIIICVVYILAVLADKTPQKGKPYLGLFNIRYYREVEDTPVKKRVRVFRLAGSGQDGQKNRVKRAKKSPSKSVAARTKVAVPSRAAKGATTVASGAAKNKKQIAKSASTSKRVYFINGKPTLAPPSKSPAKIKF